MDYDDEGVVQVRWDSTIYLLGWTITYIGTFAVTVTCTNQRGGLIVYRGKSCDVKSSSNAPSSMHNLLFSR